MRIDIGGGSKPDGTNLDPVHGVGKWRRRAQEIPWPAENGSVDVVRASHSLEHIPAGSERIAVFNEAHRVLRPGGEFRIAVPLIGYTDEHGKGHQVTSWHAWADPTHVSQWWFPESLYYFTGRRMAQADYGIEPWTLQSWEVILGWLGEAVLTK